MASTSCTMPGMTKKNSNQKPRGRRPAYTVYARISPELGEAFEQFLASRRPKPTLTSAVEMAIEELLKSEGLWPPKS
jgi:hypothetical protein